VSSQSLRFTNKVLIHPALRRLFVVSLSFGAQLASLTISHNTASRDSIAGLLRIYCVANHKLMDVRHPHQEALRGNDGASLDRPILLTPHSSHPRFSTATVCSKYLLSDCWRSLNSFSCTHRESQPCRKSHLDFECAAVRSRNDRYCGTRNPHMKFTVIHM
jgi:hypothetical protein